MMRLLYSAPLLALLTPHPAPVAARLGSEKLGGKKLQVKVFGLECLKAAERPSGDGQDESIFSSAPGPRKAKQVESVENPRAAEENQTEDVTYIINDENSEKKLLDRVPSEGSEFLRRVQKVTLWTKNEEGVDVLGSTQFSTTTAAAWLSTLAEKRARGIKGVGFEGGKSMRVVIREVVTKKEAPAGGEKNAPASGEDAHEVGEEKTVKEEPSETTQHATVEVASGSTVADLIEPIAALTGLKEDEFQLYLVDENGERRSWGDGTIAIIKHEEGYYNNTPYSRREKEQDKKGREVDIDSIDAKISKRGQLGRLKNDMNLKELGLEGPDSIRVPGRGIVAGNAGVEVFPMTRVVTKGNVYLGMEVEGHNAGHKDPLSLQDYESWTPMLNENWGLPSNVYAPNEHVPYCARGLRAPGPGVTLKLRQLSPEKTVEAGDVVAVKAEEQAEENETLEQQRLLMNFKLDGATEGEDASQDQFVRTQLFKDDCNAGFPAYDFSEGHGVLGGPNAPVDYYARGTVKNTGVVVSLPMGKHALTDIEDPEYLWREQLCCVRWRDGGRGVYCIGKAVTPRETEDLGPFGGVQVSGGPEFKLQETKRSFLRRDQQRKEAEAAADGSFQHPELSIKANVTLEEKVLKARDDVIPNERDFVVPRNVAIGGVFPSCGDRMDRTRKDGTAEPRRFIVSQKVRRDDGAIVGSVVRDQLDQTNPGNEVVYDDSELSVLEPFHVDCDLLNWPEDEEGKIEVRKDFESVLERRAEIQALVDAGAGEVGEVSSCAEELQAPSVEELEAMLVARQEQEQETQAMMGGQDPLQAMLAAQENGVGAENGEMGEGCKQQ